MTTPLTPGGQHVAASSSLIATALAGPERPARWLGGSASALYLELAGGPVIAILAADAVRLPCGVLLPRRGAEYPLTGLMPAGSGPARDEDLTAGRDEIRWRGPSGPVTIRIVRRWAPARVAPGRADRTALRRLSELLSGTWSGMGFEWRLADDLALAAAGAGVDAGPGVRAEAGVRAESGLSESGVGEDRLGEAVRALLGRGTGLTPAGDDLLAGYLLGARAFGSDAGAGGGASAGEGAMTGGGGGGEMAGLERLVRELAGSRTTALSAQLLGYAADGYCVDQAAALAAALTGRGDVSATGKRLLAVGHTSGAALAWGLLLAAEAAS